MELDGLDPKNLSSIPDSEFEGILKSIVGLTEADRKENQLLYYKPVSKQAERVHTTDARVIGVGGGNGSGKTEHLLVEEIACATGVFPLSLSNVFRPKFRGPINVRIICQSLTTVLYPIMLPKLKWWVWTGDGEIGGTRGHWGWIPKNCLLESSWDKSWTDKLRILKVLCRDPDDIDHIIGESTIQFGSYDQDAEDFASGDFHIVHLDEPPPYDIWRENEARTMRVSGRMLLSMTWPDDPSIPVDWIFDEVYDRGKGPNKRPDYEWIELHSTDNPHLNQESIAKQMAAWSDETRQVRIYGRPIRFSNRIHHLFTDIDDVWCFTCGKPVITEGEACSHCGSEDIVWFNHVKEMEAGNWPVVFLLDPHPRKPHMFLWVAIDPADDLWVLAEGKCDGDPDEVKEEVDRIEEELGLDVRLRLMDPNMGRSPATAKQKVTWEKEFANAGLHCDLADDSDVGRGRINEFLKPDRDTWRPRLHFHPRCVDCIYQIKRYTWDEHKKDNDRDVKQKPRTKYDDYPTLLKYLLNWQPTFTLLREGGGVYRRPGKRKGAY